MFIDQDFTPGGATAKRLDFRSPGSVALREVFDVGYAVHRLEEEGKRRKKWKQGYRTLNPMDEEEDEYDSEEGGGERSKIQRQTGSLAADDVAESLKKTNLAGPSQTNQHKQPRVDHRTNLESVQKARRKNAPFELSLDNATLLGRRKKAPNEQPVYVS